MTDPTLPPARGYEPGSEVQTAIRSTRRHRTLRYQSLARVLGVILAGYLLFDRAFAWIHIPGTPLFVGELAMVFGLYVVARSREVGRFVKLSPPMQILIVFMGYGAVLTVFGMITNDMQDTARDAAIWYYGLFAIIIGTLAKAWEPAYELFLRWYTRIIPIFLGIGVVRLIYANRLDIGILIPDSDVPVTSHKPGNLGVQAVLAVAFLLLVIAPEIERKDRLRNTALTVAALLLLALAGTQNRGVLVAGFVALLIVYLAGREARPMMGSVLMVLIAALILAFSFNIRFDLERRTVSVDQLFSNILSIDYDFDPDGTNEDDGTIAWRIQLWTLVMEDTFTAERFLSGFGFGPNLAARYGFVAGPDVGPELRNPHNSHLSVVARMGLIGAGLWLALWGIWFRTLHRARKRFQLADQDQKAGFMAWCMVGALAMLINGVFDPSLEGPQAAIWLWCIFGLGAFVAIEGTVVRWSRAAPGWTRR
ncbi:MAG: O-antigen ligase family protein [Acidimicrobiia bacterium]|nr:O-antigen ligase family protein [Acidimicrobiia bacterium]MBT8216829.1 O-antigen ligase family protein [Acidimicrobiia bacterium]NNF10819.1 O-antigen ligase family protein [Acidimicrobiia bacterium]NNL68442.1 O-antigen ligase family protein [Acidimicrobiia bacterium]